MLANVLFFDIRKLDEERYSFMGYRKAYSEVNSSKSLFVYKIGSYSDIFLLYEKTVIGFSPSNVLIYLFGSNEVCTSVLSSVLSAFAVVDIEKTTNQTYSDFCKCCYESTWIEHSVDVYIYKHVLKKIICTSVLAEGRAAVLMNIESTRDLNFVTVTYCLFYMSNGVNIIDDGEFVLDYFKDKKDDVLLKLTKLSSIAKDKGLDTRTVPYIFVDNKDKEILTQALEKHGVLDLLLFNNEYILIDTINESLNTLFVPDYIAFSRLKSGAYSLNRRRNAVTIVEDLDVISKDLGLYIENCKLYLKNLTYTKDYSSDILTRVSKNHCQYGLIIDCEGTTEDGCSEVGVIIYCRQGRHLIKLETIKFTGFNLDEGFTQILERYSYNIERYIPNVGVYVLTYGVNDKHMISTSLKNWVSKGVRRKVEKYFNYVDCQEYVNNYMDAYKRVSENHKLSNIAKSIGVTVVEPKHDALNDAKTTFNVLSQILLETGVFVTDNKNFNVI